MSLSPEVWQKIRAIEIQTRRMISGTQLGNYTTAFKGSGFEFDQLREYNPGDDVRFIDWPSSARAQKLLVRQYHEERNRTILLLVDLSPSTNFGSTKLLKRDMIGQIASVLALVSHYGKDTVGLIVTGGEKVQYFPPGSGLPHIHRLMADLLDPARMVRYNFAAQNHSPRAETNLLDGVTTWLKTSIHRPLLIMVSDFIEQDFGPLMSVLSKRAETIAIRCLDTVERQLPQVGLLTVKDTEHGTMVPLSIGTTAQHHYISWLLAQRIEQQTALFRSYGIDLLDVSPSRPFMGDIINFFRTRRLY